MQKLHKPKDWRWLLHRALSIIFSRTVVTVVLVLAQAVWLFSVFYWTLFFLIPALTMKSISEERKDGTFELLFSKPIKT